MACTALVFWLRTPEECMSLVSVALPGAGSSVSPRPIAERALHCENGREANRRERSPL